MLIPGIFGDITLKYATTTSVHMMYLFISFIRPSFGFWFHFSAVKRSVVTGTLKQQLAATQQEQQWQWAKLHRDTCTSLYQLLLLLLLLMLVTIRSSVFCVRSVVANRKVTGVLNYEGGGSTLLRNVGTCSSRDAASYTKWTYISIMKPTWCTFHSILLRIKGLYMFRALLAHLQEALHKRHLVYCVHVMSVGCCSCVPLQPW
jgi:hypothetical protein